MYYTSFLPDYSVGEDCYDAVPKIAKQYGKTAVVIGGKTAMSKAKPYLDEAVKDSEIEIIDYVWYGGDSSYENAQMLIDNPVVQKADMIFAVGGGRAVDTCKVVFTKLDKPFFTFPTVASNCAACTAIAVIYNADGTFKEYFYPKCPSYHTFINTRIIADSPDSLLWAGIGDALSKEYEVLFATRAEELFHTTLLGAQLSKACTAPLIDFGAKALEDCKANKASYELEQVALDIIISTGIVSNLTSGGEKYYYNSSLGHAFYYGSTVIPKAEKHLHGEVVSFGVLCLLTYDNQLEERERIMKFHKTIGLPTCLADMEITEEDIPAIVEKASTVREWTCVPYATDKDKFAKAIKKKYFTNFNTSPYNRFFIIECEKDISIPELKTIIIRISDKYSKLSQRAKPKFCPFFCFWGIEECQLIELKKSLVNDGILFSDGYDFRGADFNPLSIVKEPSKDYPIKLRIVDSIDLLEDIFARSQTTIQIYQFYKNKIFYENDNHYHVKIPFEKINDIALMI